METVLLRQEFTSPMLYEPNTRVGRSDPHRDGDTTDERDGAKICTNGSCSPSLEEPVVDALFRWRQNGFQNDGFPFDEGPPGREEIHTQVVSFRITPLDRNDHSAYAVRAGNQAPCQPRSLGEVESLNGDGFPAESFFNMYVDIDVDINRDGTPDIVLFNRPGHNGTTIGGDPLIIEATNLTSFPPKVIYKHTGRTSGNVAPELLLGLPNRARAGEDRHDCDPVPVVDEEGRPIPVGWLRVATHGINFGPLQVRSAATVTSNTSNLSATNLNDTAGGQCLEGEDDITCFERFFDSLPGIPLPIQSALKIATNPSPVCPGENFDITLQVAATINDPVSAAQAYLTFDPTKIEVESITNGDKLDFALEKDFNNTDGYIHFGASVFVSSPPTETFNLMTIHLKALGDSGSTNLQFDPKNTFVISGNELFQQVISDNPIPITLQCQLKYQVNLQGRSTPPDPSWITALSLSGDLTGTMTSDESGQGQLPQALANGDYTLCVKNAHTLQNQVKFSVPLAEGNDFVDFGILPEGDADDDNHIDLMDFVQVYLSKDQCDGDPNYNPNADFNADGCVGIADAQLLANNYGKAGQNCGDTPAALTRRRPRDNHQLINFSLPPNLTVGSRFELPIQIDADAIQRVAAVSAYLNFDPQQVQVNSLTKGEHSLDFLLQNRFDNTLGTIDFVAVLWSGELVTQPFTLVTVDFTLLAEGGEQTIEFNTIPSRQTWVTVIPPPGLPLPISFPGQCPELAKISPVSCQFYAVANESLSKGVFSNSQLLTINRENYAVETLGPLYEGYDVQALAIHPQTNRLYAVSGAQADEHQHKGRLYMVDGDSGELCWVGDRNTGFNNVTDLAFSPDGSILWGWADGQGLIQIDPTTGEGQLVRSLDVPLAGFTLSRAENGVFLGVLKNELWKYNRSAETVNPEKAFERLCANLPDTIGAVEMTTTAGLLLGIPDTNGLGLYPFDPELNRCELGTPIEIPLQPEQVIADVVLPTAACAQ